MTLAVKVRTKKCKEESIYILQSINTHCFYHKSKLLCSNLQCISCVSSSHVCHLTLFNHAKLKASLDESNECQFYEALTHLINRCILRRRIHVKTRRTSRYKTTPTWRVYLLFLVLKQGPHCSHVSFTSLEVTYQCRTFGRQRCSSDAS